MVARPPDTHLPGRCGRGSIPHHRTHLRERIRHLPCPAGIHQPRQRQCVERLREYESRDTDVRALLRALPLGPRGLCVDHQRLDGARGQRGFHHPVYGIAAGGLSGHDEPRVRPFVVRQPGDVCDGSRYVDQRKGNAVSAESLSMPTATRCATKSMPKRTCRTC